MPTREEQLAHYEATLERYVRGEATSAEVAAADPYDAALRRMAKRAYERRNPTREKEGGTKCLTTKRSAPSTKPSSTPSSPSNATR